MKTRSKPLYEYLLHSGALHGTPEELASAKMRYRKIYKRNWRRRTAQKKEIRFMVTPAQLQKIQLKARAQGLRHTSYVRSLALSSIGEYVADDSLLRILQLVGMAAIAASRSPDTKRISDLLTEAESLLLLRIRRHKYTNTLKP